MKTDYMQWWLEKEISTLIPKFPVYRIGGKEIGVPQSQKEGSWREKGWWLGNDSTQRVLNSDGNWTHEACAQTDKGKCASDLQPIVMKLDVDANDTDEGGELDHLEGEDGLESKRQQSEPNE